MLKHLVIENIALIEHLEINFSENLNILSGETGAGKSIILGSLSAVLGDKVSSDIVRAGAENAFVEAVFDLSKFKKIPQIFKELEIGLDDNELIIRRDISSDGKTKCRVNSRSFLLSQVKAVSEHLVDIHGQHEHQSLLVTENHLILLDRFAEIEDDVEKIGRILSNLNEKYSGLKKLKKLEKDRERILELSKHASMEIEAMNLDPEEEENLEIELKKINSMQKISQLSSDAYSQIYRSDRSALHSVERVVDLLKEISLLDPEIDNVLSEAEEVTFKLENLKDAIKEYNDKLEYSDIRTEEIQTRLFKIRDLKRKYGCKNVEELINYSEEKNKEIEEIEQSLHKIVELEQDIKETENILKDKCLETSKARREAAKKLSGLIEEQLKDLGIDKGKFAIDFKYVEDKNSFIRINDKGIKVYSKGIDKIEFLISTNAGEKLMPLKKVASGGELSRVMLALKTVLSKLDDIETLIFDEIDSGIGGETGFSVGKKLKNISSDKQVVCITHLAQIASMANENFKVYKFEDEGRTKTSIKMLDNEERINEIARMIGGDEVTEKSIEHAKELIEKGNN